MTQTRMNNLITLHVHKERTDALDLKAIANEFTARNERPINNLSVKQGRIFLC